MIACPKGTTDQYHGPPNQSRDIVGLLAIESLEADTERICTAFPHGQRGHCISLCAVHKSDWGQLLPRRLVYDL